MEVNANSTSNSNSEAGGKTMPFAIDLNEMPDEVYHNIGGNSVGEDEMEEEEDDDDEVVVLRENVVLRCVICGKREFGERRDVGFKCLDCLVILSRGAAAVGAGFGGGGGNEGKRKVLDLDMNAMPPEAEGECGSMFMAAARRAVHNLHAEGSNIRGTYNGRFVQRPFQHTHFNLLQMDNGSNCQNTAWLNKTVAQPSCEISMVPVSFPFRKRNDVVHALEKGISPSHATPSNHCPTTANQVYLETLRETISEWGGSLGDGWHVEFVFCEKRFKTFPVYHAPDESKYESMSDVASHLGMRSSFHIRETKYVENGVATVQKGSRTSKKRKDAPGSSRFGSQGQRQSSSGVGLSAGSDIIIDHELHSELGCFPMQFEDFYLISAGNVDVRPSYHTKSQFWPVGYKSSWHDKITGSIFVSEVADGGDVGPLFKVKRYPCTTQTLPICSTVLRPQMGSSDFGNSIGEGGFAALPSLGVDEEDTTAIEMVLTECSPPHLESDPSMNNTREFSFGLNDATSETNYHSERGGNSSYGISGLIDVIGEFSVEERSTALVWKMVAKAFLKVFDEAYKLNGRVQLLCRHDGSGMDTHEYINLGSLSKFSHSAAPNNIKSIIDGDISFTATCETLEKWLGEDRFGLDAEFVQEIIEQLPGVAACTEYKALKERNEKPTQQTVGSGFLLAQRKNNTLLGGDPDNFSASLKKCRKQLEEHTRDHHPPGQPLSSRLPACLMGDALQAWEVSWRFSELLGLEEPFTFQDLELELLNPWLDRFHPLLKPWPECSEISGMNGSSFKARMACQLRTKCSGSILAQMHGALLKILAGELLSRVAVYVDPNFDTGETKSKRGRKKESEITATVKKMMLDMVPINEFTWPEVARRYVLAMLSMECNLDSSEIACRESGKVFHCLRGDGGTLCGSLTGVAGLEADAVLLAEAVKTIFGSPKSETDSTECKQLESAGVSKVTETKTGCVPEWALALEPVRKLPTNVGARIRKCIHLALEKDPPDWAKKVLEHSISKEVYKGNASGPTKRAVISVLTDLGQKIVPEEPEKIEKEDCIVNSVTDLVMKQCRIVLRRVAAEDEDRIFCNLLGRTLLKANDNDDEGLLGYPAMVSRPLDFRSIDLRLAAGTYCGSHEAFYDDVQEVWHNIRTAFKEQSDSIKLAEKLSKTFEEMYDKEVLTIVQKTAEYSGNAAVKERDDSLSHASESSIPKAPWEDGICKVCGMDKDDDNVLLCDGCDSEYHRYCLNPPLVKIPEGNWYCPSCVSGQSTCRSTLGCSRGYNKWKLKKGRREYRQQHMQTLNQLADAMMIKEYWELSSEERVFLLKFLCDEVLNSAVFRDHIDQCASLSADLQQKLRSLTSELKIQRLREEILSMNAVKDSLIIENGETTADVLASDTKCSSQLPDENGNINQTNGANIVHDSSLGGKGTIPENNLPLDSQQEKEAGEDFSCNASVSSTTGNQGVVVETSMIVDSTVKLHGSKRLDQADLNISKGHDAESGTPKNEISALQDAIATVEKELLKVSVRKEFLGRDSYGRIYWVCSRPGSSPSIIANSISRNMLFMPGALDSSLASTEFSVQKWYSSEKTGYLPNCAMWVSFNSDSDIEELVEWLHESDEREKELKESILHWRRSASKIHPNDNILKKEPISFITSSDGMDLDPEFPYTKALASLKKKVVSCPEPMQLDTQKYQVLRVNESRICRCECLEPLYPLRHHCLVCHQTFVTDEEQINHTDETCKAWAPIPKSSYHDQTTPFNMEEIMTKFIVPNSLKDLVNQVGFIGPDSADDCGSIFMRNSSDQISPKTVQSSTDEIHNGPSAETKKLVAEENQSSSVKDKGPLLGVIRSSIIHEFAQRPLVGRVSEVLRCLKICLLDMDAALPEAAFRTSRSCPDRRRAWCSFTKYASTIYEMIQATVTLEDSIKSEFLRNDWWYWASPSAAAKITTLSALALRIFALDAAILYEKSLSVDDTTKPEKPVLERQALRSSTTSETLKPDSPSIQQTPDPPDSLENTRSTRSRTSKRRRDTVG